MKVYDIIAEETDVAEAPVGAIKQAGRKLAAKGLSKIGMKGKAGQIATKVDVGDEANRVKQELQQYMAGSGIKKGELSVNDFINFLKNVGFSQQEITKTIRKHAPKQQQDAKATLVASEFDEIHEAIDMRVADKVIRDLVQIGFKAQAGGKQARSKYATQKTGKKAKPSKQELAQMVNALKQAGYKVSK